MNLKFEIVNLSDMDGSETKCAMEVEDPPLNIGQHRIKYLEKYLKNKILNLEGAKMNLKIRRPINEICKSII